MSLLEAPEAFLYQRLSSRTSVSQYVSNRVFPLIAPQNTPLPLIVYQRTAVERPQSLAGNVGNPVVTLQLTTYGTSYTSVKNIARAVRMAIDGWTGTTASVTLQRTTLISEADGVDMPADDQMLPYYSVQQSFEFRINETLSTPKTVPGAPTITTAVPGLPAEWTRPVDDGGADLTNYRLYIDGVWDGADYSGNPPSTQSVDVATAGTVLRVSAVNAIGEGPLSAPVTVT